MYLSESTYVPALRWRQAEYQALFRLSEAVKDRIVPLITIPPVEFDFELRVPKKSIHEHVYPFCKRYLNKWRNRPAWVALDGQIARGRMNDSSHVFDFVLGGLRPEAVLPVPVLGLDADTGTIEAAVRAIAADGQGVAVLIQLEDLMMGNLRKTIGEFSTVLGVERGELDLIVDLRAQNFEPYNIFAHALIAALGRLGNLYEFRNLVLLATAIPESLAKIAKGTDEISRHDWLFYNDLLASLPSGMRKPNYGDHTIVHPDFTAMDMRKVKSAGKLVYTTPHTWATRKGGAFREDPAQMHTHCQHVVSEPAFAYRGENFSSGDRYIADCAKNKVGPSNHTRWKEVAINHHITVVVDDLAILSGTPLPP